MSNFGQRRSRRAGGARRAAVLGQVVGVIAERGYTRTRFTDIAEASGVAVSTLQGYFGSREDMLIEALHHATTDEVAALEQLAAGFTDPWEQLIALVDRGLFPGVGTWRMLMEFRTAAAHDADLRQHVAALAELYRQPFAGVVERGIESGAFRPRFEAAAIVDVLIGAMGGLLYPVVLDHRASADLDYRDVVLAQLAFVLGGDPA